MQSDYSDKSWNWLHKVALYDESTVNGKWNEEFQLHRDAVFSRLEPAVFHLQDLLQRPDDEEMQLEIDRELKQVSIQLDVTDNLEVTLIHELGRGWRASCFFFENDGTNTNFNQFDEVELVVEPSESYRSLEMKLALMVCKYLITLGKFSQQVKKEISTISERLDSYVAGIERKEVLAVERSRYKSEESKKSDRKFILWIVVLFLAACFFATQGGGNGCDHYQNDPRGGFCD